MKYRIIFLSGIRPTKRFSATDLRASRASSETACLPTPRPRESAANLGKSLGKPAPIFCQSCVNLCVIVCVLRLGGASWRITNPNTTNKHKNKDFRLSCLNDAVIRLTEIRMGYPNLPNHQNKAYRMLQFWGAFTPETRLKPSQVPHHRCCSVFYLLFPGRKFFEVKNSKKLYPFLDELANFIFSNFYFQLYFCRKNSKIKKSADFSPQVENKKHCAALSLIDFELYEATAPRLYQVCRIGSYLEGVRLE